jgi:N6-adenosine-specific RNA methylase IME4
MMQEAMMVMRAWGFTYKTVAFVWTKVTGEGSHAIGMGHWTRANAEFVLLGTRGRPKRASASVRQIVEAPRADHSAKPAQVRGAIEELIHGRRIELFARERVPGWDAWGLEVVSTPAVIECLGVAA